MNTVKKWYSDMDFPGRFIPEKGWSQIREFRDRLYQKQKGKCFYCDIQMTLTGFCTGDDFCCEHLTPRKRGGLDHPDNIVGACSRCNIKKGKMTLEEYIDKLKKDGTLTAKLAGKVGGRKTAQKYGIEHFTEIANKRHSTSHV